MSLILSFLSHCPARVARGAPSFLDARVVHFSLFGLILNWRQHAVVRVLSVWVVEHLDVVAHVLPCGVTCQVCLSSDTLPFRQLNEDFCDGIVMAIPASAHAGSKIVFAEERLPLLAGELSALVGMDHHLGLRFAPSNSTQQGLKSEVRCHARLHGPPDDTS